MALKATALPDIAEELKVLLLDVDARNRARIESLKGPATAELAAYIAAAKYADGLTLYGQEKIFSRLGMDLSRFTRVG